MFFGGIRVLGPRRRVHHRHIEAKSLRDERRKLLVGLTFAP